MKPFAFLTNACALLLALVVLGAGCEKKVPENVLATVGTQVITVADLKAELKRRTDNRQPIPDRQALLEDLITRATLLQRAKVTGLDQNFEVRRMQEDVLIAKLKETELEPRLAAVKVTTAAISNAYQQNAARFTQPAKTHLAIIYLAADAKMDTNQLSEIAARANAARQQALALPLSEKGFGRVALDFSDDQVSRYRGGEAGWFTLDGLLDRWPQVVVAAGVALKNSGEVSEIIRAADGFYFAKKMDARAAVELPLAQVQGGLEHQLLIAQRLQAEKDFRQSLRLAVPVQTNAALLAGLAYPNQNPPSGAAAEPPALPANP